MFNACLNGNLSKMQELYSNGNGVPLSILHPYNNINLLIVALNQGASRFGLSHLYEHYYCKIEIVEWLLSELSKNKQLEEIWNVAVLPEDKERRKAYENTNIEKDVLNMSTYSTWRCSVPYAGKSLMPIFDAQQQAVIECKRECDGQWASANYHFNVNICNNANNLFNNLRSLLSKYSPR